MHAPDARLILASTSPYRRELLRRLRLPFAVQAPHVDETPRPHEAPAALAERLALAKTRAVARDRPRAVVIGADQVAELDGQALGKPGSHAAAVEQLRAMSGRSVAFHTVVAVLAPQPGSAMHAERSHAQTVWVRFRTLGDDAIEAHLRAEQPYDCAGSAKCEGLGIVLLDAVESSDPTALVGLPLIATARLLREAGLDPLRPTFALR